MESTRRLDFSGGSDERVLGAIFAGVATWRTLAEQNKQTAELRAWTMGGDSFGYYEPLLQRGRRLAFFIRHRGAYPAFDVIVRIHEVDAPGERLIEGPFKVGTLSGGSGMDWTSPETLRFFSDPPPSAAVPREFRIEIQARNGVVVQRIKLWPEAGRWHTSSKDIKLPTGGHVDPGFHEAQDQ